ncbi:hypothetical protein [Microvirga brassicacearum]|uniref:Uncharacterized protein n=1 Tax=Microvirga brassicacearum TaxID=2580413 RepID=A0A5N3P780_9HYPH|nr:hypothetical protein [Microvirga brassicacearum]KAB0265573.1 hypothetical protein FEZ63_18065 [Microvirga brassicacearum]
MTIGRRPVLQGLAATGFAAVAPGFSDAHATVYEVPDGKRAERAIPWIATLSITRFTDDFLAGLARARSPGADIAVLRIDDFGSEDLLRLQAMLTAGRRQTLVGLVNDGLAAIIGESARTAGARLRWLGQHTLTPTESRHRLLTASGGCAAWFAEALTACGSRFSVNHHDLSAGTMTHLSASSAGTDRWAFALGQTIAMANGLEQFHQRHLEATADSPERGPSRAAESLVSFSYEL